MRCWLVVSWKKERESKRTKPQLSRDEALDDDAGKESNDVDVGPLERLSLVGPARLEEPDELLEEEGAAVVQDGVDDAEGHLPSEQAPVDDAEAVQEAVPPARGAGHEPARAADPLPEVVRPVGGREGGEGLGVDRVARVARVEDGRDPVEEEVCERGARREGDDGLAGRGVDEGRAARGRAAQEEGSEGEDGRREDEGELGRVDVGGEGARREEGPPGRAREDEADEGEEQGGGGEGKERDGEAPVEVDGPARVAQGERHERDDRGGPPQDDGAEAFDPDGPPRGAEDGGLPGCLEELCGEQGDDEGRGCEFAEAQARVEVVRVGLVILLEVGWEGEWVGAWVVIVVWRELDRRTGWRVRDGEGEGESGRADCDDERRDPGRDRGGGMSVEVL